MKSAILWVTIRVTEVPWFLLPRFARVIIQSRTDQIGMGAGLLLRRPLGSADARRLPLLLRLGHGGLHLLGLVRDEGPSGAHNGRRLLGARLGAAAGPEHPGREGRLPDRLHILAEHRVRRAGRLFRVRELEEPDAPSCHRARRWGA